MMKYYSDITKEIYDTVAALREGEAKANAKATAKEQAAAKVEEAKKVYDELVEAQEKARADARKTYCDALKAYCAKYGAYEIPVKDMSWHDTCDIANDIFDDILARLKK